MNAVKTTASPLGMGWARQFPVENLVLDASLASAALWLPQGNAFWSQNLTAALWIAAPLQVDALFCAFYARRRVGVGSGIEANAGRTRG